MSRHNAQRLRLEHDAWIFLADGRKALFLRNEGDTDYPVLQVEDVRARKDRSTQEAGVDRPTRVHESLGPRRSTAEQSDWHQLEEDAFARQAAATLDELVASHHIRHLVVVAPPRTLAVLRRSFTPAVRDRISAEIDKDLTNRPVHEIEEILLARA